MKCRAFIRVSLHWVLLVVFAVVLGDYSYRVWNPAPISEYMVDHDVEPLSLGPNERQTKHLYLRRTWSMTRTPEKAWIEVLGHDRVEVFVNGFGIGRSPLVCQGRVGAVMNDITPLLHKGRNSIAIHLPQLHLDSPPEAVVIGKCEFADGSEISLSDPAGWKSSNIYEHHGDFWYETEFDDEKWTAPQIGQTTHWRAKVVLPPGAVTVPRRSKWILPVDDQDGAAAFARSFELAGAPKDGWLRVMTTGSCRVAVNGWLIADDRQDLGVKNPFRPIEYTFDVSALLEKGTNTISIFATTDGQKPRLRADLEASALNGAQVYVATDETWQSAAGSVENWQTPDLAAAAWQSSEPAIGYLGAVPRAIDRELVELNPPLPFWMTHWLKYIAWMVFWGISAGALAAAIARFLERNKSEHISLPPALSYVALFPSTVLALAGGLMTWDLAWSNQDIYQPLWLLGLILLVVAQWLVLAVVVTGRSWIDALAERFDAAQWSRFELVGVCLCWTVLIAASFWLRVRDIVAEPIHHDEVTAYAFTIGVLEHGFPGGQVDPDIPFGYCATNELTYYFNALCTPFFDDPRLVIRVPSMLFSMASLLLIGYVGWRWFNGYVGFVAAVLFGFSPHIIGMANFGRYLSQVQFFTLLTMFFTYEAVRGTGKLPLGLLWASTISFAAMYLSWEGTGMFGVGLAIAVLFHRRRHLREIFACPQFYAAVIVLLLVVVAQNAHRVMQQTQRLWYGEGISSLTMKPMWRYPFFQYDFYVINSGWTRDSLLPTIALVVACALAYSHKWRYPLRFSIICFLGNAMLMASLLPVRTNRYAYHLTEILMLIAAAVLVAGVDKIVQIGRNIQTSPAVRWYLRGVATAAALLTVALCSGWFLRMSEMSRFANSSFEVRQLRFPDWEGTTQYLKSNLREGDAVISIYPHSQDYMFAIHKIGGEKPRKTDFWLQSRLVLQATLGDSRELPLDRRSGAVMVYNLDQVKQMFAQYDRVWYCTMRLSQSKLNDSEVSRYLRDNMEVVCEDFGTALMFHDRNNRPARIQIEDEAAGRLASEYFLR